MGPSSDMPAHARLSSSLQAETRAEFAERSVAKLEKTIDDLEGMNLFHLMFRLRKTVFVLSLFKSTKTAMASSDVPSAGTKGNSSLGLQCEVILLLFRC